MAAISVQQLGDHTDELLREVETGSTFTITRDGRAVATLGPAHDPRPTFLPRAELLARLVQADPALRADLRHLTGDTTDSLGPVD